MKLSFEYFTKVAKFISDYALVLLTYLNVSAESGPFEASEPVETNHKPG